MKTLIYPVMGCIQSCIPGALELQEGEQVTLLLDQEKNANFAESLLGTVTQIDVATGTDGWTRRYHIQYDEDELGEGITSIEMCDVLPIPRCFSCCEFLEELIGSIENNIASPLVGSILNSEEPLDIDFSLLDETDVTDLATLLECKVVVCSNAPITGDGTSESPLDVAYAGDNTHGVVTLAVPDNYPANINSETEAVTPAYLRDAIADAIDTLIGNNGCGLLLDPVDVDVCNPQLVVLAEDTLTGDFCLRTLSSTSNTMGAMVEYGLDSLEGDITALPWTVDTLLGGDDVGQGYIGALVGTISFNNPCEDQVYRFEIVSGGQEPQADFKIRGFGLVINGEPRTPLTVPTALATLGNFTGYQNSVVGSYLLGTLPAGAVVVNVYWVQNPTLSPSAVLQGYPAVVRFRILRDF